LKNDLVQKLLKFRKKKFLVPKDVEVGAFMNEIRRHIPELGPKETLYMFVHDNQVVKPSTCLRELLEKYKDEDGLLYFTYDTETIFG